MRWWPLTPRGTGAAIAALACLVLGREAGLIELMYFGVLLCAVLVASLLWLYLPRQGEHVTRTLSPDVAAVGRETAVRVRVGVRTTLPTSPGIWNDAVSPGVEGHTTGDFPATPPEWSGEDRTVELRYRLTGTSRGVHRLGPLSITRTDPFGLARRRLHLGERTRVLVAPAIVDIAPLPAASGEAGGILRASRAQPGEGADNLLARPYAPGDSMRRIHWRASAHRDELMVRQEEQEASPEATVLLDRCASRWGSSALRSPGADAAFETGVSACISAVMRLVHDGYTVEVVDTDGSALSDPIASGEDADVEALATRFATLTTRAGEDLARTASLFTGAVRGPVVMITGRLHADDVVALAPIPHHSALAVLLGVDVPAPTLDRATGYGWRAAGVEPGGDLARAWAVAIEHEATHVR